MKTLFSLVVLTLMLLAPGKGVAEIEDSRLFAARTASMKSMLRIIGSTDLAAMENVINAFQSKYQGVAIKYDQAGSIDVYKAVELNAQNSIPYDLAISSAMDLQIKLVNDGFAQSYNSTQTDKLSSVMKWRNRVFGFTREPVVIVYNTEQINPWSLPKTRFALLEYLRENRAKFQNRLATYDVQRSGAGYLFASQDSLQSETYWRLMEVFGDLSTRLSCCTSEMLDLIEKGELMLAYNVVGSYAQARVSAGGSIGIHKLDDYTLVMNRSALIPVNSGNLTEAGNFIDHLLSSAGQEAMDKDFGLMSTDALAASATLTPIRMDPGLLVFLDRMKRQAFVDEWKSAIVNR